MIRVPFGSSADGSSDCQWPPKGLRREVAWFARLFFPRWPLHGTVVRDRRRPWTLGPPCGSWCHWTESSLERILGSNWIMARWRALHRADNSWNNRNSVEESSSMRRIWEMKRRAKCKQSGKKWWEKEKRINERKEKTSRWPSINQSIDDKNPWIVAGRWQRWPLIRFFHVVAPANEYKDVQAAKWTANAKGFFRRADQKADWRHRKGGAYNRQAASWIQRDVSYGQGVSVDGSTFRPTGWLLGPLQRPFTKVKPSYRLVILLGHSGARIDYGILHLLVGWGSWECLPDSIAPPRIETVIGSDDFGLRYSCPDDRIGCY